MGRIPPTLIIPTHFPQLNSSVELKLAGNEFYPIFVKDYKNGGATEQMELPADEFIRRFLMHILPRRFRKIRYAGFLAPAIRDEKLKLARQSLQDDHCEAPLEILKVQDVDVLDPVERCPKCHIGRMQAINIDRETMQRNWMLYMNSS